MEVKTKRVSKGRIAREAKAVIREKLHQVVAHHRSTKKENPIITNRMDRRSSLQQGSGEAMRKVKRAQYFTKIKDEAAKIKKKFRKNFRTQERWIEIENEVGKIFGRKGETNLTPAKKKRK